MQVFWNSWLTRWIIISAHNPEEDKKRNHWLTLTGTGLDLIVIRSESGASLISPSKMEKMAFREAHTVCGEEVLSEMTFTGLSTSLWSLQCWLILTNTPRCNLQVTSAACSTELCLSQTARSSTAPSSLWTVSTDSFTVYVAQPKAFHFPLNLESF